MSKPQHVIARIPFDSTTDDGEAIIRFISEHYELGSSTRQRLELDYAPSTRMKPEVYVVTFGFDPESESLDPLFKFSKERYGGWPFVDVTTVIYGPGSGPLPWTPREPGLAYKHDRYETAI